MPDKSMVSFLFTGIAQLVEQEIPNLWCRKTCVGSKPTARAMKIRDLSKVNI